MIVRYTTQYIKVILQFALRLNIMEDSLINSITILWKTWLLIAKFSLLTTSF